MEELKTAGFFSINLSRLMAEMGLTQEALAAKAGVGYHTVFRAVSKGVIPRGENQTKLANALGVSVADLHEDPKRIAAIRARRNGRANLRLAEEPRPDEKLALIEHPEKDMLYLANVLTSRFADEHVPKRVRALVLFFLYGDKEMVLRPYLKDSLYLEDNQDVVPRPK